MDIETASTTCSSGNTTPSFLKHSKVQVKHKTSSIRRQAISGLTYLENEISSSSLSSPHHTPAYNCKSPDITRAPKSPVFQRRRASSIAAVTETPYDFHRCFKTDDPPWEKGVDSSLEHHSRCEQVKCLIFFDERNFIIFSFYLLEISLPQANLQ